MGSTYNSPMHYGFWSVRILMVIFASIVTATTSFAQYTQHGKLKPFWRYSAALGGYPDFHASGQSLVEVPEYMLSGNDFPYQKRPFPVETLFADHLSMVRFLGGHEPRLSATIEDASTQDLAYRVSAPDGSIEVVYRLELVESRLRPYLDAGYEGFTLVFDNIPWGMTDDPHLGYLGQAGIPYNFDVWADFVEAVCREIYEVVGQETATKMRFRTGTEFSGTERYDGIGDEDFIKYFNASWEGVSRVFPDALFGPFNIAGVSVSGIKNQQNVNAFNIPALKTETAPFDWVSYSHYFLPGEGDDTLILPFVETWNEFKRLYPELEFSKEIHEFGIQPWTDKLTNQIHQEPGASGIVTTIHTLLGLWNEGLQRCWHWSALDQYFNDQNQRLYIPKGIAWIYSVLDKMIGGEAYYLQSLNQSGRGTLWTGIYSRKEDEAYLLLNAYNPDLSDHTSEIARFRIPKDSLAPLDLNKILYTSADLETVVHDVMYRDLKEADLLYPFFRDNTEYRGLVKEMAYESDPGKRTREGSHFLASSHEKYVQVWDDSLTLKQLDDRNCKISDEGNEYEISIEIQPPEAVVLRVPLADNLYINKGTVGFGYNHENNRITLIADPGASNRLYTIYTCTNLAEENWEVLQAGISGLEFLELDLELDAGRKYYKMEVALPEN